MLYFSSLILK